MPLEEGVGSLELRFTEAKMAAVPTDQRDAALSPDPVAPKLSIATSRKSTR